MKKNNIHRIIIAASCVAMCIVLLLYAPALFHPVRYDITELQGWISPRENGTADTFDLPHPLRWDSEGVIELYTQLPEGVDNTRYVGFWTYFSHVDVYVGETAIYHFNNSETESFGAASTSQWHFVRLPQDGGHQRLTIRLRTPYTDMNPRLTGVLYGDLHDLHHELAQRYYPFRLLEDLMVWVALVLIVVSIFYRGTARNRAQQVLSGLFLLLFSFFVRTGTKSMPLEFVTPFAKDFICYFAMFTMAIPLSLYMRSKVPGHPRKVMACNLLAIAELLLATVSFILHALGVVDIHYMLPVAMLLLFATFAMAVIFAVSLSIRQPGVTSRVAAVGPVLLWLVCTLEYANFYWFGGMNIETGLVTRTGIFLILIVEGYLFFRALNHQSRKQDRIAEEHRNLQLQMLTDNIHPHFMLNTIGAIRTIIPEDPERASDLLLDFSCYVRENLEQKDYYKPIPFVEELEYIRTYLSLERARFGDTIQVYYECDHTRFHILPLTVQPFVENAVKHGLFTVRDGGKLWITTEKAEKGHVVEITDNGVGFDADNLQETLENKKAVGMRSAILRLESEMNATVTIRSNAESGTQVRIYIPESK